MKNSKTDKAILQDPVSKDPKVMAQKNIACSSRKHGLKSQYLHGSAQPTNSTSRGFSTFF